MHFTQIRGPCRITESHRTERKRGVVIHDNK